MKTNYRLVMIILVLCFHHFMIYSQNESSNKSSDPSFTSFLGEVYSMPILRQKNGKLTSVSIQEHYGDNIYTYKKIGDISYTKINIRETNIEKGKFPGVNKTTRFAMVLNAQMKILNKGCYEFALNSDDGSILWLNNQLIIDNDGGHKMRMKKDTVVLDEGSYDAKLWYFQGMPDRFGFIFDSKYIGGPEYCSNELINKKRQTTKKIILNDLNFESSKYILNQRGIEELIKIAQIIKGKKSTFITVVGHTDNKGSIKDNQVLSLKRAEYIASELKVFLENDQVKIVPIGKGMSEPIGNNNTKEGKASNRRVEIIIK